MHVDGLAKDFSTKTSQHWEMGRVSGGTFSMSSDNCYPEEAPARHVKVEGFWIERYAVTNERERSYEPQRPGRAFRAR